MTSLLKLPSELKLLIFVSLNDIAAIIRLRMTCKTLFTVSYTRQLWVWLYHQYLSENPWASPLEEPIKSYNGQELSTILTNWLAVDAGWTSVTKFDKSNTRSTEFHSTIYETRFVPGGRWLLLVTNVPKSDQSAIYVCDLKNGSMKLLAMPRCECIHRRETIFVTLRIKLLARGEDQALAFLLAYIHNQHDDCQHPVTLWKVHLEGHGDEAILKASTPLSVSLPWVMDVAISDTHMAVLYGPAWLRQAQAVDVFQFRADFLESHRIVQIDVDDHDNEEYGQPGQSYGIRFLPGQKLLFSRKNAIEVYDLSRELAKTEDRFNRLNISELKPGLTAPVFTGGRLAEISPFVTDPVTEVTTFYTADTDSPNRFSLSSSRLDSEDAGEYLRERLDASSLPATCPSRCYTGSRFSVLGGFLGLKPPGTLWMISNEFKDIKVVPLPKELHCEMDQLIMDEQSGAIVIRRDSRYLHLLDTSLTRRGVKKPRDPHFMVH